MAVAVYNVEDIPTKRALLDLQKQIDELKAVIEALKKKLEEKKS